MFSAFISTYVGHLSVLRSSLERLLLSRVGLQAWTGKSLGWWTELPLHKEEEAKAERWYGAWQGRAQVSCFIYGATCLSRCSVSLFVSGYWILLQLWDKALRSLPREDNPHPCPCSCVDPTWILTLWSPNFLSRADGAALSSRTCLGARGSLKALACLGEVYT